MFYNILFTFFFLYCSITLLLFFFFPVLYASYLDFLLFLKSISSSSKPPIVKSSWTLLSRPLIITEDASTILQGDTLGPYSSFNYFRVIVRYALHNYFLFLSILKLLTLHVPVQKYAMLTKTKTAKVILSWKIIAVKVKLEQSSIQQYQAK